MISSRSLLFLDPPSPIEGRKGGICCCVWFSLSLLLRLSHQEMFSRKGRARASISPPAHMGQFLQDGENTCFVSFFFLKVEPSCYKTWYSRVYFSIVSSKLGLVHQKITSWPSVMIFLSSFFLVVLAIFSKFWGMFRALVCPYYQRETFFDPTIISAVKFWWFSFFLVPL